MIFMFKEQKAIEKVSSFWEKGKKNVKESFCWLMYLAVINCVNETIVGLIAASFWKKGS